jgi:hypothetical protein
VSGKYLQLPLDASWQRSVAVTGLGADTYHTLDVLVKLPPPGSAYGAAFGSFVFWEAYYDGGVLFKTVGVSPDGTVVCSWYCDGWTGGGSIATGNSAKLPNAQSGDWARVVIKVINAVSQIHEVSIFSTGNILRNTAPDWYSQPYSWGGSDTLNWMGAAYEINLINSNVAPTQFDELYFTNDVTPTRTGTYNVTSQSSAKFSVGALGAV